MRSFVTLIVLISLFCSACQKEENVILRAGNCNNCINFESPSVGQESRYLAFEGEQPWEEQPTLRYLKDTLIVRILSKTGDLFQVEEYRTSNPSDLLRHTFQIKADTLYVKVIPRNNYPDSWLFNAQAFPLQPLSAPVVQLKGWNILVFAEKDPSTGVLKDYEQLGSIYNSLNVYHDYSPMLYDGAGHYMLYSQQYGVVRSVTLSAWQGKGLGWDLVAN